MPAAAPAAGLPPRLGKYELLLPLAAGGMARIYIGRATGIGQFERHVVLKMITPERANDTTAVNMFLDEARLAASLNHQNVAQVFEVGEDTGIHYLAMEYVHGQDLRALLAKAGGQGTRIPLELALTVVAGAAAGLNHAHERRGPDGTPLGIVHRDVSPSNIMIGYDGAVKLLDFGIAKATARSVETQSGIIKGKFAYMAPEQCRGRDVDRRSDVFSLGIILYEISTQHRCFRADSDFDTMHRIVTGDVVRPTRLVQGYPQALEAIVMKALAVDANQRYQSAGLLLEAIESFAVASRMSLSTMGLGRFMRDMFGEVQEPWLNTAAIKMAQSAVPVRESTISSTDSHSDVRVVVPTESSGPSAIAEGSDESDEDDQDQMATFLHVPGRSNEGMPLDFGVDTPMPVPMREEAPTNPPGFPTTRLTPQRMSNAHIVPAGSGTHPIPSAMPSGSAQIDTPAVPRRTTQMAGASPVSVPQPMASAMNTPSGLKKAESTPTLLGTPPAGHFAQVPPSITGPALPIGSTRHGYAGGAGVTRGDVPYSRHDSTIDPIASPDVQVKPNRRPLIIGLAVIVLGVVVMLAVLLGSKESESSLAPAHDSDDGSAGSPAPSVGAKQATPVGAAGEGTDDMVTIVIESDPAGADVLIAGAKIGVTPFNEKLKRGTKTQTLTVRKSGYADFTTKVDLAAEYENKHIKLLTPEEAAKADAAGSDGQGSASTPVNRATAGSASGSAADAKGGEGAAPTAGKTGASTTTTTTPGKTGASTNATTTPGKTGASTTTATGKAGTASTTTSTATKSGGASASGATGTGASTGTKTSTGAKAGTGTSAKTSGGTTSGATTSGGNPGAKTKPKCQPPGPNVDPFGPPICKS